MSRIGKVPVDIPSGVKVNFENQIITVEGPKGKLTQNFNPLISFKQEGNIIEVNRANDEKQTKSYHGLYRNLLNNMVIGVSTGFSKTLIITGVGYRAELQGNLILMNLGYSSDIYIGIPEGIKVGIEGNSKITVSGINKQVIGEFAAQIRKLRVPEPYKGKGIKYENEIIRRKVGKSGVK
ncbi:50S ribosomal protein L6 [Breznakiellaceae bacterium SP9]